MNMIIFDPRTRWSRIFLTVLNDLSISEELKVTRRRHRASNLMEKIVVEWCCRGREKKLIYVGSSDAPAQLGRR